jgi:Zn-dependent peptidase ImmA (M78 family)
VSEGGKERRRRSPLALAAARKLLRELDVHDPDALDLELVSAHKGMALGRERLASGAEGQLVRTPNGQGLALIDERAFDSQKWRFVTAHELAHFLRHTKIDSFDRCFDVGRGHFARERQREQESEASDFATELTMPVSWFAPACDCARPSLRDVRPLVDRFGMSLTATAMRFVELCPEPCALVWSTRGRVTWWDAGDGFGLWLEAGSPLARETVAYDAGRGERVEDEAVCVEADAWGEAWGDGGSRGEEIELWEHSMALTEYEAVLTLLWQRGT